MREHHDFVGSSACDPCLAPSISGLSNSHSGMFSPAASLTAASTVHLAQLDIADVGQRSAGRSGHITLAETKSPAKRAQIPGKRSACFDVVCHWCPSLLGSARAVNAPASREVCPPSLLPQASRQSHQSLRQPCRACLDGIRPEMPQRNIRGTMPTLTTPKLFRCRLTGMVAEIQIAHQVFLRHAAQPSQSFPDLHPSCHSPLVNLPLQPPPSFTGTVPIRYMPCRIPHQGRADTAAHRGWSSPIRRDCGCRAFPG